MTPRRLPGALGRLSCAARFASAAGLRLQPINFFRRFGVREVVVCFAGLWRPMPDGGAAFTLLTTEPGPDVAPIHNRQMVVVERTDWSALLDLTRPDAELLQPLPAGSLTVEQIRP
jgi:putative SOS response-associated peptidase YedK